MQSRQRRLSSRPKLKHKRHKRIRGSVHARSSTSPEDLKTIATSGDRARARGVVFHSSTGHEPIHQFPPGEFAQGSLHFNEPYDDCVTHQTRDVVDVEPFHQLRPVRFDSLDTDVE